MVTNNEEDNTIQVRVDRQLVREAQKIVDDNPIEYPSFKNWIDRLIKKELDKKKKKEEHEGHRNT